MHIATVITHQRVHSDKFIQFKEIAKKRGIVVSTVWSKPVGEWTGINDILPCPWMDFSIENFLENLLKTLIIEVCNTLENTKKWFNISRYRIH